MKKNGFVVVAFFIMCFCFSGCYEAISPSILFVRDMVSKVYVADISKEVNYDKMVGKKLLVKKEMFLKITSKKNRSEKYYLYYPLFFSGQKNKIIVPEGTILKIIKIERLFTQYEKESEIYYIEILSSTNKDLVHLKAECLPLSNFDIQKEKFIVLNSEDYISFLDDVDN